MTTEKNNRKEISTKDHVLRALEERRGESISGSKLAASLSLSRAAVWKAICELRTDGHCITAASGKGYSLSVSSDVLSPQGIAVHLHHRELIPLLHTYEVLESTNLTAKQLALTGAPHGTAVVAACQTAGRGRLGRSFYSPKNAGIYFSVIFRPQSADIPGLHTTGDAMLMTTATAVAAARAIEAVCGKSVQIKWVNDLYLDGKKVCGILTEGVTSFESGTIESIVIGIGMNCFPPEDGLPPEIQNTAGALMASTAESTNLAFVKNELIAAVLDQLMDIQADLASGLFLEEYRRRSCILGEDIRIFPIGVGANSDTAPTQFAKAVDIDPRGGLIVEFPDKNRTTLSSGEISIRTLT